MTEQLKSGVKDAIATLDIDELEKLATHVGERCVDDRKHEGFAVPRLTWREYERLFATAKAGVSATTARATPKDEARPDFAGTLRTLLAIVIELHEYAYNGGDEVSRRCLALRDTMAAAIVAFEETARRAPKDEAARLHEWANALLGLPDSMVLPAVQQARLQWPANRANGTADAGGTSGAGHSAAPVNEPHSVAGHSQRVPEDEAAPTVTDGVALIAAERRRQVEAEGWTPEHDDEHEQGEMAVAAACYAVYHTDYRQSVEEPTDWWPWLPKWWKPSDAIRNLTKAGALIAAEIDRIQRRDQTPSTGRDAKGGAE